MNSPGCSCVRRDMSCEISGSVLECSGRALNTSCQPSFYVCLVPRLPPWQNQPPRSTRQIGKLPPSMSTPTASLAPSISQHLHKTKKVLRGVTFGATYVRSDGIDRVGGLTSGFSGQR